MWLGHDDVGRRLDLEAGERERSALIDGADRIHQSGGHRYVERAGRELLDDRGACRDIDQIRLDVLGGKEPFIDSDEDRPQIGRRRAHRAHRDGIHGARGCDEYPRAHDES